MHRPQRFIEISQGFSGILLVSPERSNIMDFEGNHPKEVGMNLEISYRDMGPTEAIKGHIESKAQKLEKHLREDELIRIVVGTDANHKMHYAEVYWHDHAKKTDFFARREGDHLYTQIDEVFEAVAHQIQKQHDKRVSTKQHRTPLKKAAL